MAIVRRAIERDQLVRPGDRGLVAVSGGPDSLCLLHLLARLRAELSLELEAAVVDHGLRSGAAEEAKRAARIAEELGVPAVILRAGLGARGRGNLQARARQARLGLLEQRAEETGCDWVALGHTASDQAETVLMRAIRGAGLRGLAGMAPRRDRFIRPLLDLSREQVLAYLEASQLVYLEDPSNLGDAFLRNRLRHHVLPLLAQENPRLDEALCRIAASCREDDGALETFARQTVSAARRPDGLDLELLAALPPALLHRVLRLSWRAAGGRGSFEREHMVRAAALVTRPEEGTVALDLPGLRLERRYRRLVWIERGGDPAPRLPAVELRQPGWIELADGRALYAGPSLPPGAASADRLAAERAPFPLLIRGLEGGDRIRIGATATRKVARLLIDAKVPRAERRTVPLIFASGRLVLVAGIKTAFGVGPVADEATVHVIIRGPAGGPGSATR